MYKLTPKMEQHFRNSLTNYHKMFDGGRCQGWELEELIVNAIKSDTKANHLPKWKEGGHDDAEDILVVINGKKHKLQIKSGKLTKSKKSNQSLVLSGHRLGRFKGDFDKISEYLNNHKADILSIPYRKEDNDYGRRHIYRLCYIPSKMLSGIKGYDWTKEKSMHVCTNQHGVRLSLHPSMSWQIWWNIPLEKLDLTAEFCEGNYLLDKPNG